MRVLGIGLSIRLLELGENDAVAFYSSLLESAEVSEEGREDIRRILEEKLLLAGLDSAFHTLGIGKLASALLGVQVT